MGDSRPIVAAASDEQVLERLRALARQELEMSPDDLSRVGMQTLLVEGLLLDSLRQVVLVAGIEDEFGFELTLDDRDRLLSLRTVGDLVRLIRDRAPAG